MAVRSCKVTITDLDGVAHTVDVTAATLYEAVALGMAAIRTDEWSARIAQGLNSVQVRVMNVPREASRLPEMARKNWRIATRNVGPPKDQSNTEDLKCSRSRNICPILGEQFLRVGQSLLRLTKFEFRYIKEHHGMGRIRCLAYPSEK
jgi:hypothetical protein